MIDHWFIVACFWLLFLAVADVLNQMRVDARPNYIMVGMTLGLGFAIDYSLWYVLAAIVASLLFNWLLRRISRKNLGRADIVAVSWIYLGLVIINPVLIVVYVGFLAVCIFVVWILKLIFKFEKAPFLPAIFFSFLCTYLIYRVVF